MTKEEKMGGKLEKKVRTYSYEEALSKSLDYFKGDNLAAEQWIRKYCLKDSKGNLYENSPDQMHHRIARDIFKIEEKYNGKNQLSEEKIYSLLKDFKYLIPAGSNMSGIGNNYQIVSLSNCFVIGNNSDSYGGIINTDQEQVQLMKRRGGVGHDLSHIRPKGVKVNNSALTSTGVVPFMERYSNSTKEVAQDGRRGALMLSISIQHPDSEKFIDAKLESGKVTGANVSVRVTDDFMQAVKENRNYIQQYPVNSSNPSIKKEINAAELWDKIITNAWKSGEPGVLFWDTITRESVADVYSKEGFETVSTNPCGEIPLCPYDSCRLLAINLYNYVENPFTKSAKFNFDLFKEHSGLAARVMDDIIDLEKEKIHMILEKIETDPEPDYIKGVEKRLWDNILEKCEDGRRMGIGITAEGDMLAALGLTYGSDEAINFSEEIHKNLALGVYGGSVDLAKERGAFPIYDAEKEKNNPFIQRIKEADPKLYEEMIENGRRNISCLTIAPTGTVSIMAQTTSGIEPVFRAAYQRNVKIEANDKNNKPDFTDDEGIRWRTYNVFHPKFETWLKLNGYDFEEIKNTKDETKLKEIVTESPYFKSSAEDVDWIKKIEMQGRIQKWIDHSISATTNMPKNTPKEIVAEAYMKSWESGCKGMTVYVDGSRGRGVLDSGKNLEGRVKFPAERPDVVDADLLRFKNSNENGGEDWIAFVGKIEGEPFEIFTGKSEGDMLYIPPNIKHGKIKKVKALDSDEGSRYDFSYVNTIGFNNTIEGISHQFNREFWNLARLVSGHLREGTPIPNLIRIVRKLDDGAEGINTWKSGIERALKKYVPDGTELGLTCKECNMPIIFQNGCETCGCGEKCS